MFVSTLVTGNAGSMNSANRVTTITASDITGSGSTLTAGLAQVTVQPDNAHASTLQLLLPGELHVPGKPPYQVPFGGRSGVPQQLTAGTTYSVTVNACDTYWNISPIQMPLIEMDNTDVYNVPVYRTLANGTNVFPVYMRRATLYQEGLINSATITIVHSAIPQLYSAAMSTFSVVPEASGKNFIILVPGQTHLPGTITGTNGGATNQTAGIPFRVTVDCVDSFNNIVPTANPLVTMTSSDPNDGVGAETGIGWDPVSQSLFVGCTYFMVNLVTANTSHILTAAQTDGKIPYYGITNSLPVYVNPGAPANYRCCCREKVVCQILPLVRPGRRLHRLPVLSSSLPSTLRISSGT